jgi:hypothetical protein
MEEQPERCDDCPDPARAIMRAKAVAARQATDTPMVDGQPITSAADFVNSISKRINESVGCAQPATAIRFTESRIALHSARNSMREAQQSLDSAVTDETKEEACAMLATAEAQFNEAVTEYLAAEEALRTES